jgi:hypothetical protein
MISRPTVTLLLAAALAGCGGNYSNEDVDFQLALPAQEDIAVRLPATAEVPDPAEYYKITRDVVKAFNGIGNAFLSLIDTVRAFPPSERQAGHRVWGPFPNQEHPGWQARVVIDRADDAAASVTFTYSVDVRPTGSAAAWLPLITGTVHSNGGVRRGQGQMVLTTTAPRAAGYPLDMLDGWESLTIDYQSVTFPVTSTMTLISHPESRRTVYSYAEEADGAGAMVFDFPTPQFAPFATVARIHSRWLASGAGRGDFQVLEGVSARARGTDCWSADTRASFVSRDLEPARNLGDAATCALPAP